MKLRIIKDDKGKNLTYDDGYYVKVANQNATEFAMVNDEDLADLMVRAVNSHQSLVEACQALLDEPNDQAVRQEARTALALAGGDK